MKKTAILVVLAVSLLSSGPVLAMCQECERILGLGLSAGYSESQIMNIVSNGDSNAPVTHAQMEERLKRAIAEKNRYRTKTQRPRLAASSDFRYSKEVINVPPDIERR